MMSETTDIQKGEPLPGEHHVLRYVGGGLVDRETNRIHGSAFVPREGEKAPSVNWLERFPSPIENQLASVAKCKRLNWGKSARLVRLEIGQTIATVAGETRDNVKLSVIYDPLPPVESRGLVADPSHALFEGFPHAPTSDPVHQAELFAIGFKIRDLCIVDMFEASAYR
jgi:hypothetical protein